MLFIPEKMHDPQAQPASREPVQQTA
jgi:hypothetical protein